MPKRGTNRTDTNRTRTHWENQRMPGDNVINFRPAARAPQRPVPADPAVERFGRALASIGLHAPTILHADFARFEGLPAGEVFLHADETSALRLIGVGALLESGAVVHVLEDEGHETVIVAVFLTPDGQQAVAVMSGDLPWQSFLELRLASEAA